jgi:glycosyltransferase involved in cell wall biosynthesis
MPKISIGLVVYNGFSHIRLALDSIVNQSYANIELIVIDGGSSDGTLSILNEYSSKVSLFISERDEGIYDAMNKVRSLASGDWLIFVGCDDVLLDVIADIAPKLKLPGAVYYGDAILRSTGFVYGGKFSKYRLMQCNLCHQTVFYPKAVYKNYAYSLNYPFLADYDYNIRLVGDSIPFKYLGITVSIFNNKGASSSGDVEFEGDKLKIIRGSFGLTYATIKLLRNQFANLKKKWLRTIGDAPTS